MHYHHQNHNTTKNKIVTNLTKCVQNLYAKNYQIPMKEIKEDINKCRDVPFLWIWRHNIIKIPILPKLSTDSTQF